MLEGSLEIFKDLGWDKDVTLLYIQATFFLSAQDFLRVRENSFLVFCVLIVDIKVR